MFHEAFDEAWGVWPISFKENLKVEEKKVEEKKVEGEKSEIYAVG
jgi:hypothetical protein